MVINSSPLTPLIYFALQNENMTLCHTMSPHFLKSCTCLRSRDAWIAHPWVMRYNGFWAELRVCFEAQGNHGEAKQTLLVRNVLDLLLSTPQQPLPAEAPGLSCSTAIRSWPDRPGLCLQVSVDWRVPWPPALRLLDQLSSTQWVEFICFFIFFWT